MEPGEREELRVRVANLEREVERLRSLVEGRPRQRIEPGPPPVIDPLFVPAQRRADWERIEHQRVPVQKETKPPSPRVDSEFKFGSQVLPRVGIVLVLLGILYLVAYAVQSGWVSPGLQFVGELALCGTLIGLGVWKLGEREDFGQVLVGGGSCGLYLSLAGAHVYKGLISGETLVGLFSLLSLANLGFSQWRASKSFWAIGLLGGLVGAALPLNRPNFTATYVLAGVIVVAATVLAARQKWQRALDVLWTVSSGFVFFVTLDAIDRVALGLTPSVFVFLAFSAVPLAAHALVFEPSEFDPLGWFEATAGGLTALAVLAFGTDANIVPHSIGAVVFAGYLAALAYAARARQNSVALWCTAIAVATMVAPLGLTAFQALIAYSVFGALAAVPVYLNREKVARFSAAFCAAHVLLTVLAYSVLLAKGPTYSQEMVALALLAFGVANLAIVAGRLESRMEGAATAAFSLLYFVLARAVWISSAGDQTFPMLVATAIYGVVVGVVSVRARWQGPGYVSLALATLATFLYWLFEVDGNRVMTLGQDLAVLALSVAAIVLSGAGIGKGRKEQPAIAVGAAIMVGFAFVPMVWTSLSSADRPVQSDAAWTIGLVAYSLLLSVVAWRAKSAGYARVGMMTSVVGIALFANVAGHDFVATTWQIALALAVCASVLLSAGLSGDAEKSSQASWVLAAVTGWYPLTELFFLLLTLPSVRMEDAVARYSAWVLFALVSSAGALRTKWTSLSLVGSGSVLLAVIGYWVAISKGDDLAREGQLALTLLATGAIALCAYTVSNKPDERRDFSVLAALLAWGTLAPAVQIALLSTGMAYQASITFSWSVYAGFLLALGFLLDVKHLRIVGLAIFGITLVKVFLVDLSALEAYIRVFLLIAVGSLLILAGYLYIRLRRDASEVQ